jgi:hypothetical protein
MQNEGRRLRFAVLAASQAIQPESFIDSTNGFPFHFGPRKVMASHSGGWLVGCGR